MCPDGAQPDRGRDPTDREPLPDRHSRYMFLPAAAGFRGLPVVCEHSTPEVAEELKFRYGLGGYVPPLVSPDAAEASPPSLLPSWKRTMVSLREFSVTKSSPKYTLP